MCRQGSALHLRARAVAATIRLHVLPAKDVCRIAGGWYFGGADAGRRSPGEESRKATAASADAASARTERRCVLPRFFDWMHPCRRPSCRNILFRLSIAAKCAWPCKGPCGGGRYVAAVCYLCGLCGCRQGENMRLLTTRERGDMLPVQIRSSSSEDDLTVLALR